MARARGRWFGRTAKAAAAQAGAADIADTARSFARDAAAGIPAAQVPPATAAALADAGMGNTEPFAPGRPIAPYFPVGTEPRAFDYKVGVNLITRPRASVGRMSFDTMRELLKVWDIARICIEHRQDDVRAVDHRIVPKRGVLGDVSDAVARAEAVMRKPDGVTPFDAWQSMFLEDVLRYDAGTLYKARLMNGQFAALEVVDGTTIGPLLDYEGRRPQGDTPAFVQFIHGLPGSWHTADSMVYQPFRAQPEGPYGLPPLEWTLLTANTDVKVQWHFLNYFTEGTLPAAFAEAPPEYAHPDQILELQNAWDQVMEGDLAMKRKMRWVPAGSRITPVRDDPFDPRFAEWLLKKACSAWKVRPNDIGFTDDVNRATADVQAEVQARVGRKPLLTYLKGIYDSWLQEDLLLPVEWLWGTGEERDDKLQEAQANQLYVEMGAQSVDEVRERVLGLPVDHLNPIPRYVMTRTGLVPLASVLAISGDDIDPDSLSPTAGSIEHVDDEPQPASLPGQEQKVQDIVGPVRRPPEPPALAPAQPLPPAPGTAPLQPQANTALPQQDAITKELAVFGRFAKTRAERGRWRDFDFRHLAADHAGLLNAAGRIDPALAVTTALALTARQEQDET
jgi:hypothetical protein